MNGSVSESTSFGPFKLFPMARAIEKEGVPLVLGARALDILIVLVEHAGEVVSHKELFSRVWRGLLVDPGNLRVHMTGLRKALGERGGKARYIANVPGQGYCFVAPIRRETSAEPPARLPEYPCGAARQRLVLPPVLARMVGREEAVRTVAADLIADRFVSIIGPGGMGKTTVAVSVAHAMLEEFADAVCFVDISTVAEPRLVAATIASTLGLTVQSDEVLPALLQCLRTLRVLLVLDNCEHVIDATATLAERIFNEASGVHILATSREALRAEGEHAYCLPPLASPRPDASMTAAHALTFPAVKLFMERVAASGSRFELSDADAPIVVDICARLDGIALAIEIAAARVATHGLAATSDLLSKRLSLHWQGRRTAPPRHQTLQALLDWSYSFLAESERRALSRLSIFVGPFTIEAAEAIACEEMPDESHVISIVDGLVSKSLVSSVISGDGVTRYRLLETTRAYGQEKLDERGETQTVAHRHAKYFASLLDSVGRSIAPHHANRAYSHSKHLLGNIRAALEWCFDESTCAEPDERRDPVLAIKLAAGSVPILLELSLLSECQKWSAAALALLDETTRGSSQELVLLEARAISSTWALGNSIGVRAGIARALEIARNLGETSRRLRLLVAMHVFLLRIADLRGSLTVAEAFDDAVRDTPDASYKVIADWLLGSSHHFMGDQAAALRHFERGFACSTPLNVPTFGLDYRVRALVTFARVLWLSGFADRARDIAQEAFDEAAKSNNPLNVCFSFVYAAPVLVWRGDLGAASDVLEKLMAHPNWHALPSLHATTFAVKGELLVRRGAAESGVRLLRSALITMKAERQKLMQARAGCALAEGLLAIGAHDEALIVIHDAIAEVGDDEQTADFPELLRMQAEILLCLPAPDESAAEDCLMRALTVARRQSALAWERRIAMTLARLRARQGRGDEAREWLVSLDGRFSEGFETSDLKAAKQLLLQLDEPAQYQRSA